jgi:hypothetical protein
MELITKKADQIKEEIAKQLKNVFWKDGFVYKKTMNEFKSQKGDYAYIFNIDQVAWSHHYSLDVRLYISQKQIENILERIIGKLRHHLTLGRGIDRIYKSPDGRKVINGNLSIRLIQNEDIEAAVETLEKYYNDIAMPYFERYTTLKAIDDIINSPPFDCCPAHVGGNFDNRCMKGLIVAKLVNNPSYEELVRIYDDKIKGTMNTQSIENYYKVRDYLMYNSIK